MTFANNYFSDLWAGIARESDRENYCLLHFPISTRVSALAEAYLLGKVEGIIMFNFDKERAGTLAAQGVPILLMSASQNIPSGCSNTYSDEAQTTHLALQHLWDLGHRRIAHIAGPTGSNKDGLGTEEIDWRFPKIDDVAVLRLNSYITWMKARDIYDPEMIIDIGAWEINNPDNIVMQIKAMKSPPTALFCANDGLAIDLLDSAQRLGIKVPEDISIVGVDGSVASKECYPKLTTVVIPATEVGRQGFRTMLNMTNQDIIHQYRVKVPVTELAIRASTGPVLNRAQK